MHWNHPVLTLLDVLFSVFVLRWKYARSDRWMCVRVFNPDHPLNVTVFNVPISSDAHGYYWTTLFRTEVPNRSRLVVLTSSYVLDWNWTVWLPDAKMPGTRTHANSISLVPSSSCFGTYYRDSASKQLFSSNSFRFIDEFRGTGCLRVATRDMAWQLVFQVAKLQLVSALVVRLLCWCVLFQVHEKRVRRCRLKSSEKLWSRVDGEPIDDRNGKLK
jgi:hypothetical protein